MTELNGFIDGDLDQRRCNFIKLPHNYDGISSIIMKNIIIKSYQISLSTNMKRSVL